MYDELAEGNVPEIRAGVDIGKTYHHTAVINAEGTRLLSRRVQNDETELLALIGDLLEIAQEVLWAVDLNHGGAALLIGLLVSHGQPVAYLTAWRSTALRSPTTARARRTRRMPSSSPTRPAFATTSVCCGPSTRSSSACAP